MTSDRLRVARILHATSAEGPFLRTAVWVQGCSIRCRGCINPHLFPFDGGTTVAAIDVVADAVEAGSEGITLLGGEPFDQAEPVTELARAAQGAGLGIICFTGYEHEPLTQIPEAAALLEHIDLLVDGPYIADRPESSRSLVGSRNQRFLHLTDRYRGFDPVSYPNRVEFLLRPNGEVGIAGFLVAEQATMLASRLELRLSPHRKM